jgi:hypothetical protein
MPLKIGQIDVSYLGGPNHLSILFPTDNLAELCKEGTNLADFPPLLLIGDDHSGREYTCKDVPDCINENSVCLSTMNPIWYSRLY